MATTSATTFTEDLRADIQTALESGVPRDDLLDMVNIAYLQMATAAPPAPSNGRSPHIVNENDQELPIYDVLPPGLIDVPSAVKQYGCKNATLRRWIERGRLRAMGRLRGAAPGGGYLVISETELTEWISAPRDKGGRPRKKQF